MVVVAETGMYVLFYCYYLNNITIIMIIIKKITVPISIALDKAFYPKIQGKGKSG